MRQNSPPWPLLAAAILTALPLHAEDWITTDGKVFHNVKVLRVEADAVTIIDHDGSARIPLSQLPPDLQKKFADDFAKAQAAADARAKPMPKASPRSKPKPSKGTSSSRNNLPRTKRRKKAAAHALGLDDTSHVFMPAEPDVLEANKHVNNDPFQKPKP